MKIRTKPAYSFDDVLLVPQYSTITSRQDVDLSTKLGKLELKLPLLSANMDTVTEDRMAITMASAGGAGILHRFASLEDQYFWLANMRSVGRHPRIISIGLNIDLDHLDRAVGEYATDAVCVDVAHGDHYKVEDIITAIRTQYPHLDIIAGNVATASGARRLVTAGANIIKVGIGPGSVCSTRVVTGHGVPQLTAIIDVAQGLHECGLRDRYQHVHIIADGGIRYPGDIVKALAAGADAVMLGSLLAGTNEAPGERIVEHGQVFKMYRGMASLAAQKDKKENKIPRVEGVSARVPYRGPVDDTLGNLKAGIRSGLSYSGASNIEELRNCAEFVVVTGNTLKESHPHHPYRL